MPTLSGKLCASAETLQMKSSFIFFFKARLDQAMGLATLLLAPVAVYYLIHKSTFPSSTKILLLASICYASFHEVIVTFIQGYSVQRSLLFKDSPCEIMFTSEECITLCFSLIMASTGMIGTQTAMSIDMIASVLLPARHAGALVPISVVLLFMTVSYSILLPSFLFDRTAPLETISTCFNPPQYMFTPYNQIMMSNALACVICLVINITVICINRYQEKKTRYDIKIRYQKREALVTSKVVCSIAIALLIAFGGYAVGGLVLRSNKEKFSPLVYSRIFLFVYTYPYAALSTPALIILASIYLKRQRRKNIKELTETRETINNRIAVLKNSWNMTMPKVYAR
ncbi:unnamed protein product [Caenorhabditis auriculariae]|uniref:Uncharacterized protein n=1 Tax=Caenorhabditis auriculariae TaxID=2777116 RepID=A0A8S1HUY9_9PELO|nr:unnamed protein product [Caenorhabditis auriculariae]